MVSSGCATHWEGVTDGKTSPDGRAIQAQAPDASALWSAVLGRPVVLKRAQSNQASHAEIDPATVFGDVPVEVEQAIPVEQLSSLQGTFCSMEPDAMLQAALVIVHFYQELAPLLARTHDISYPAALAPLMSERLEQSCEAH
jgi:hypothetical protein